MKKLLIFMIAAGSSSFSQAQDILTKKNGEEIRVKVLEINPDIIKYKRFDNLEGPTISIYKRDVITVTYANGVKDVISSPPTPPLQPAPSTAVTPTPIAPPPKQSEEPAPYQMKLNGPRFGITYLATGKLTRKLEEKYDVTSPVISQFGWQFETQIFNIENGGPSGLIEFIPLVGGLDQGIFLPSASLMFGCRSMGGMEVGFGPNFSAAGTGVVIAAGTSFTSGNVHFPINFAVVPSKDGTRYSLMFGFNYRQK